MPDKLILCTASAGESATNKQVRTVCTELQKYLSGLEEALEDPLKSKFTQAKAEISVLLAGIPESGKDKDDDGEADKNVLATLNVVNGITTNLIESLKTVNASLASTKAGVAGEITSAIDAKVKAGEIFTKAEHDKLVGDAISSATAGARTSALAEGKRINDRKLTLTTASIPVPADELLTGEDRDFDPKKVAAEKRVTELKPFKLEADRILALAWNTDEKAYQETLTLMKTVYTTASKGGGVNPFVNRDGTGDTKPVNKSRLF